MNVKQYREFVITADGVEKDKEGLRQFTVQSSSFTAGDSAKEVRPVPADLRTQLSRLERRLLGMDEIIALGEALADLLLPDKVRGLFVRSLDKLQPDQALRVRLRLAPALAEIPWEYMYIQRGEGEKDATGFLALDPRISIVRHEAVPIPADIETKARTRRLLFALASPKEPGYAELDLARERDNLKKALKGVPGIELDIMEKASLEKLNDKPLRNADIFHFAGHGTFKETGYGESFLSKVGKGEILLVAEGGGGFPLPADQLAVNLRSRGVQLVILGACQTGRRDEQNVWSGVAAALMEVGIPAVVAMQYNIWDEAAIAFSRSFYQALAAGLLLDEAVSAGRLAAFNFCHPYREDPELGKFWRDWAVPVFYLRTDQNFLLPAVEDINQRKILAEGPRSVVDQRFKEIGPKGVYKGIEAGVIEGGTIESHLKVEKLRGKAVGVKADAITGGNITAKGVVDVLEGELTGVNAGTIGGSGGVGKPSTMVRHTGSAEKEEGRCPKCHERVKAGSKFCSNCGDPIPVASKFCTDCGTEIVAGAKFCSHCGRSLL